jgi:hypothetical protein
VVCPECGEPLREGPRRRSSYRGLDRDIRLDNRGVGVGACLLAGLGGLSLFWMLALTGSAVLDSPGVLVGAVPPLIFLLGVFAFFYLRRPQEDRSVGVAVVRTLATVGVMVGVLIAFLILFFAVCLVTMGGGW